MLVVELVVWLLVELVVGLVVDVLAEVVVELVVDAGIGTGDDVGSGSGSGSGSAAHQIPLHAPVQRFSLLAHQFPVWQLSSLQPPQQHLLLVAPPVSPSSSPSPSFSPCGAAVVDSADVGDGVGGGVVASGGEGVGSSAVPARQVP